jgi:hypothetical protein
MSNIEVKKRGVRPLLLKKTLDVASRFKSNSTENKRGGLVCLELE